MAKGTSGLVRKNTESKPVFTSKEQLETPRDPPSEPVKILPTPPVVDEEKVKRERQNLAEIHKRIRQEKQTTGRVLSVNEAKKLMNKGESAKASPNPVANKAAKPPLDAKQSPTIHRQKPSVDKKVPQKDKLEPSKLVPLNRISQNRREQNSNNLQIKTPSMIDLAAHEGKKNSGVEEKSQSIIPKALTFDDI